MNILLENTIRKIIREELINTTSEPGTMNFWHGGDLNNYEYQ